MSDREFDPQRMPLSHYWHRKVVRPIRNLINNSYLRPHFIDGEELPNMSYIFYPLHSEPEISLSLYGRFNQNQIEVVRNIAQSVPMGVTVLVKEHPIAWGMRTPGYYKKLLEIPNVRIISTDTDAHYIIKHAMAVIIITGTAGFEAVLQGVPAIALGNCAFSAMPDSMIRTVRCFEDLSGTLQDLLDNYTYDRNAIIRYLAATMDGSVPLDFYSTLLGKDTQGAISGTDRESQLDALTEHLWHQMQEESSLLK
jgi:hypothetical protein